MKNFLLSLLSFLIVISTAAQWSAGGRAGINFTTVKGKWSSDDATEIKWITTPAFGAVGSYSFTDMWSANAELTYLWMGEKYVNTYEEGRSMNAITVTEMLRFHSLQMAILAQALFGGNLMIPYVICGMFLTLKLGGVAIIDDGTNRQVLSVLWQAYPISRGNDGNYYVDPQYNRRTDFGLYLGGGVGKELGPGKLNLDLRFGLGLLDLNKFDSKEDKQQAKDNGYKKYNSMNVMLTLAYMFSFNKN